MTTGLSSSWKKAQTVSTIIATVLVPVIIGYVGHSINQSIKNNELALNYIELSVGILKELPSSETENLRKWAIEVINNYSDVKMSIEVQKELKEQSLPIIIESSDQNPLAERAKYISQKYAQRKNVYLDGMSIDQHLLIGEDGQPVSMIETDNLSGKLKGRKFIVLHFTGSSTGAATINWMADAQSGASIHLVIDRNGGITQLVPFDYKAWHAGRSEWKGVTHLNNYSIGITFINAGKLSKYGEVWKSWSGKEYPKEEVYIDSKNQTAWHTYSVEQIDASKNVIRALIEHYPEIEEIIGHSDITKGRKSDPGPAFPINELKNISK